MVKLLKNFFLIGLAVHVFTTLLPAKRLSKKRTRKGNHSFIPKSNQNGVKNEEHQLIQQPNDSDENESPFIDPFFANRDAELALYPPSPLKKAWNVGQRVVRAPLGAWRLVMLSGVTVSYLAWANVVVLLTGRRRKKLCYKILKPVTRIYLCRISLWIMGARFGTHGGSHLSSVTDASSSSHFVLTPNHVSYLDFWTLGAALGPCCVVAKRAVRDIPLLGALAEGLGAVFVDRQAGKNGKAQVISTRAKVPGQGRDCAPLLVFPEGTCTTGRCLIGFKTGAFRAGAPVLPVGIAYNTASGMSAGWVGPLATWPHFLRMLCEWWIIVDISLLPLHVPSPEELQDPELFASNVQAEIASVLQIPTRNDCNINSSIETWKKLGHEVEA